VVRSTSARSVAHAVRGCADSCVRISDTVRCSPGRATHVMSAGRATPLDGHDVVRAVSLSPGVTNGDATIGDAMVIAR
jgi:hypothetical protein